jgi:hypothetical protein
VVRARTATPWGSGVWFIHATKVDEGTDIEPDSLALSSSHRKIFWSRGGAARSDALR